MKKILTVSLLFVMLVMAFATVVSATTSAELADKIYEKGAKYGMTTADKVRIERYLAENAVTEDQANSVMEKVDAAVAVMDKAGVTNYDALTDEQKADLKDIAKEAAAVVDVNLVFKTKSVQVYKNGKLIETVAENDGKLSYTGNSVNMIVVVSVVAIIALAIAVVAKKRIAYAK